MIKTQKETSYCYYSNFNLYDNTQLIMRREKFIKSLIQSLGEEWRIYATQAITILIETQVRHLPWQFCFDNLLFAWLDNEDIAQEDFMAAALNRIRPYNVDPIYFKPVCDGFYYTSQQLWVKMRLSRPSSTDSIKSVEQIKSEEVRNITQFLKPLVRVSEKIRAYFKSEQVEPHSTKMEIEEPPVKEVRTLKQIDKIDESSLSMEMVDSAYQYVSQFFTRSYANIQVAKQFIVNIIEVLKFTTNRSNKKCFKISQITLSILN